MMLAYRNDFEGWVFIARLSTPNPHPPGTLVIFMGKSAVEIFCSRGRADYLTSLHAPFTVIQYGLRKSWQCTKLLFCIHTTVLYDHSFLFFNSRFALVTFLCPGGHPLSIYPTTKKQSLCSLFDMVIT